MANLKLPPPEMTNTGLLGSKPMRETPSFAQPAPAMAGHVSAEVKADLGKLSPTLRLGVAAVAARK
jgi:hypothetical protein